MRRWLWWRRDAQDAGIEAGTDVVAPAPSPSSPRPDAPTVPDTRPLPEPVIPGGPTKVRSRGPGAIGAGGNVSGNAIGEGSSTTVIEEMTVHVGTFGDPAQRRRQIAPPPLGEIADRKNIREAVVSALLATGNAGRAPVVFLEGYGGGGKTTIATQSCYLSEIRERFPGGVIWTVIGQARLGSNLADHIADICELMSKHRPTTTDPEMAGAALGEILDEGQPALLVVDDVWCQAQVTPFLLGGNDCPRLFTTRNRRIAPGPATLIEVDQMTPNEARETALAGLPLLDAASVEHLLSFAKGWPVLLGLINASLRVHIDAGGPPEEVTSWIAGLIDSDGPAALDSTAPQHLRSTVAATVTASLDLLSPAEQARYFDLAVFEEDSDIPEHIATLLWNAAGNLSQSESREMKGRFSALRLVSDRWTEGEPAIAIHDVLRSYLMHRLSGFELAQRHLALVTALRSLLPRGAESGEWWRLPPSEQFAMQHLPYHLQEAGLSDELAQLACDLRWIEVQIRHLGSIVPAVTTLSSVQTEQAAELCAVLSRDTDMLVPDVAPSAIGATLASRLQGVDILSDQAEQHLARLPRPLLRSHWLLPDITSMKDEGHTGPIGDCAVTHRGGLLATVSDDRLVIVWDLATLAVRRVLRGHRQRARACVFSPDGSRLLSASMDGTVRIWGVHDGSLLQTLGDRTTRILGCSWSPDGSWVSSAAGDGTLTVWDAQTGEKHREIHSPSGYEWDCSFSPDAKTLASGAEDGSIRLWDLDTGDLRETFKVHSGRIRCCTYDPSGTLIASAGSDTTVRITRSDNGDLVHRLRGHTDRLRSCAFSADGSLLVSAAEDRTARLWDVSSGREVQSFRGHTDWVGACVFTPDGRQLVSCGGDATVRFWDVLTGEATRIASATRDAVGCSAFAPGGKRLVAGGSDGVARVWDTETADVVLSVKGHTGRVLCCSYGPDGFLTGGGDGELRLWDAENGQIKQRYTGHSGRVWACSLAPDGQLMASAGEDGLVMLHDTATGGLVHLLKGHAAHVLDCTFAPSGELVASVGDDGTLRFWDPATGRLESTVSTGQETALWSCRFSPDGALIATAGEPAAELTLWSTYDRSVSSVIPIGVDRITSCAFSPSGRQIATCGDDAYLGIWDVATGAAICGVRVAYPLRECTWAHIDDRLHVAAAGNGGLYLFEYVGA
jgi:WD40 repeat protein